MPGKLVYLEDTAWRSRVAAHLLELPVARTRLRIFYPLGVGLYHKRGTDSIAESV